MVKHLQIKEHKDTIENKRIIIFDDSIKSGKTIKKALNILIALKPEKIDVFLLMSKKAAAEKLSMDPKI